MTATGPATDRGVVADGLPSRLVVVEAARYRVDASPGGLSAGGHP